MKLREIERLLTRQVTPRLPNFTVLGNCLLRTPIDLVSCSLHFEPSAFNKESFSHVYATVMPLWIPSEHWILNLSIDLTVRPWPADEPLPPPVPGYSRLAYVEQIQKFAIPMFAELGTPRGLYQNLRAHNTREATRAGLTETPLSAYSEEALGGAALIVGDLHQAHACFERARKPSLNRGDEASRRQVQQLSSVLDRLSHSREAAIALFKEWETYTIGQLKLESYMNANRWATSMA